MADIVIKVPDNTVVISGTPTEVLIVDSVQPVVSSDTVNDVIIQSPGPQGPQGQDGASGSVSRILRTFTAGEDLSGHVLVTRQTDGTVTLASQDQPSEVNASFWMTTGSALSGSPVEVLILGDFSEPSWSWSVGPIYLGLSGAMTQVPPSSGFLVQVAYATGPNDISFVQGPSIQFS